MILPCRPNIRTRARRHAGLCLFALIPALQAALPVPAQDAAFRPTSATISGSLADVDSARTSSSLSAREESAALSSRFGDEIPDWQARWELARVQSYSKKYRESLDNYRKVLAEKPDLIEPRIEMTNVLLWSGNASEAIRQFETLPLERVDNKTRMAFVDLVIAGKSYERAREILRGHLADAPDDHAARLKLAEILSWTKDYDASIAEFRRILEKRPNDVQVRRRLANVLTWANRKAEAIEELKKSLGEK